MNETDTEPLVRTLRERLAWMPNLERPLRLITGLAIADLVVSSILLLMRDIPGLPTMSVFGDADHLLQMPIPIFWVSTLFVMLAFSYFLGGALHTSAKVRVVGVLLGAVALLPIGFAAFLRPPWSVVCACLLLTCVMLGPATLLYDRHVMRTGGLGHRDQVKLGTLAMVLALVFGVYVCAWGAGGSSGTFSLALSTQLSLMSLFLIPFLVLAGSDFADWAELTAAHFSSWAAPVNEPGRLVGLTLLASVAVLAETAVSTGVPLMAQMVLGGIAIGILVPLYRASRLGQRWHRPLPYTVLVFAAFAFTLPLFAGAGVTIIRSAPAPPPGIEVGAGGPLVGYRSDRQPQFSIQYPSRWEVRHLGTTDDPVLALDFSGARVLDPAEFFVLALPRSAPDAPETALVEWLRVCCPRAMARVSGNPPETSEAGLSFVLEFPEASDTGLAWQHVEADRVWLLYGVSPARFYATYQPAFQAMAQSWKLEATPQIEARAEGPADSAKVGPGVLGAAAIIWLLVTVGATIWTVRRAQQGGKDMSTIAGLVIAVMGVFALARSLPQLVAVLTQTPNDLPFVGTAGVQASIALATLVVVVLVRRRLTSRGRRLVALLLTLNVGMQLLAWIDALYSQAMSAGARFSVIQAVVLLLALLWDVTTSGGEVTNVPGKRLPRHARMLLFLSYMMLVGTAVLYFSSLQVQASLEGVDAQFESEMWPQLGVVGLGIPVLWISIGLKMGRLLRR